MSNVRAVAMAGADAGEHDLMDVGDFDQHGLF